MKLLLSFIVALLLAFSAEAANPDYKAFRGTGIILITSNPPSGTIVFDNQTYVITNNQASTLTLVGPTAPGMILNFRGGSAGSVGAFFSPRSDYTGSSNTIYGWGAGTNLTIGQFNTVIGNEAGRKLSGNTEETIVGFQAGASLNSTGTTFNTLIGSASGGNLIGGAGVSAMGQKSLVTATSAVSVVAIGSKAASLVSAVSNGTFVGYGAYQFSTNCAAAFPTVIGKEAGTYDNGDFNVWVGAAAGFGNPAGTSLGDYNSGIGYQALLSFTSGSRNVAEGFQALNSITTGTANIGIGYQALNSINADHTYGFGNNAGVGWTSGSHSILFGENAGGGNANSNNIIIFGSTASGNAAAYRNVYIGNGVTAATPLSTTYHASGGSGTDIAGADLVFDGGQGTGTGLGGSVIVRAAPTSATGTALNNTRTITTVNNFGLFVTAGQSSSNAAVGGVVYKGIFTPAFTNLNTTIATFTNGSSWSSPAHTLTNNNDSTITIWRGIFLAGTNNLKAIYGVQTVFDTGPVTNALTAWELGMEITRTGASTAHADAWLTFSQIGATAVAYPLNGIRTNLEIAPVHGVLNTNLLQIASNRAGGCSNNYMRVYHEAGSR